MSWLHNHKRCSYDPMKMSKVCVDNDQINIQFTKKAMKDFKASLDELRKYKDDVNDELIEVVSDSLSNEKIVTLSSIDAVSCSTNTEQNFDQMFVLTNVAYMMENNESPVLNINVREGKCEKLVQKTELKDKEVPFEILDDMVKINLKKMRSML